MEPVYLQFISPESQLNVQFEQQPSIQNQKILYHPQQQYPQIQQSFPEINNFQINNNTPDSYLIPLVKCRSLYLGSSVPLETKMGLDAVQQPLRQLYGEIGESLSRLTGIDVNVTVYSSGILMTYADDPASNTWFPIQNLLVCCAVKINRITGRFVPLDSPEGVQSNEPPIFAAIIRRPSGIKVLECHAFVCKSPDTALTLVQSCVHAFQHKECHADTAPPITYLKQAAARLISSEGIRSACPPVKVSVPKIEIKEVVSLPPPEKVILSQPEKVTLPQPEKPQICSYFSNWQSSGSMPFMFVPNTPFYPGGQYIQEETVKNKKKKKKAKEYEYYIKKEKESKEDELYVFVPNEPTPAANPFIYNPYDQYSYDPNAQYYDQNAQYYDQNFQYGY